MHKAKILKRDFSVNTLKSADNQKLYFVPKKSTTYEGGTQGRNQRIFLTKVIVLNQTKSSKKFNYCLFYTFLNQKDCSKNREN